MSVREDLESQGILSGHSASLEKIERSAKLEG